MPAATATTSWPASPAASAACWIVRKGCAAEPVPASSPQGATQTADDSGSTEGHTSEPQTAGTQSPVLESSSSPSPQAGAGWQATPEVVASVSASTPNGAVKRALSPWRAARTGRARQALAMGTSPQGPVPASQSWSMPSPGSSAMPGWTPAWESSQSVDAYDWKASSVQTPSVSTYPPPIQPKPSPSPS